MNHSGLVDLVQITNPEDLGSGLPPSTAEDAGKVLKVTAQGTPDWGEDAMATVDQTYDADSTHAQSGLAVAQAISNIPSVTVDQTYDSSSTNAQSGVAVSQAVAAKQDTISDLSTIRSGASAGATAIQGVEVDGTALTPDANKVVDIVPVELNASDKFTFTTDEQTGDTMLDIEDVDLAVDDDTISVTVGDAGIVLGAKSPLPDITGNASKVLAVNSGATDVEWATINQVPSSTSADATKVLTVDSQGVPGWATASGGGSDQPLPAVATNTLRFEFENASFDPTSDTGCNFTGASWSKVTEATSRNIWDCTFSQNSSSSSHFAITEPCKVIDGGITIWGGYLFADSTGITSVIMGITSGNTIDMFTGCSNLKYCEIHALGTYTFGYNTHSYMFSQCTSLQRVKFVKYLNDYKCFMLNDGERLFYECSSLESIDGDVALGNELMNSSQPINGAHMFHGCSKLKSIENLVANNTYPGHMINNATGMFQGCYNLESVPFSMIISGSGNTEDMFNGCSVLRYVGAIDFQNYNRSMEGMFENCYNLQDVSLIRTGSVQNMSRLFCMNSRSGSYGIANSLMKIPSFPTEGVTNVENMFAYNTYADGALAMYNQLSQQANPPTTTTGCFTNCGSVTHASDLSQIPSSWGGTGT